MTTNTKHTNWPAILAGLLFVLHLGVSAILLVVSYMFEDFSFFLFLNIVGICIGTITMVIALARMKKSGLWKFGMITGLFILNIGMTAIALGFGTLLEQQWLAMLMTSFAVIVLCPVALYFMVQTFTKPAADTTEIKATISLEPVPAPFMTTSEDAYYRMLERISHKLSFALKGAKLEDPAESAFLLDITSLHLLIEEQIAVLFSAYKDGAIKDDTDAVLPLLVVDDHIEK